MPDCDQTSSHVYEKVSRHSGYNMRFFLFSFLKLHALNHIQGIDNTGQVAAFLKLLLSTVSIQIHLQSHVIYSQIKMKVVQP